MFYVLLLCTTSHQINKVFPLTDVAHLVAARVSRLQPKLAYGNLTAYTNAYHSAIVPTKMTQHVIVSLKSDKMHFFLHDNLRIRRCVWDGCVSIDEKKSIVCNMAFWLTHNTKFATDHFLYDFEDGSVFTDILKGG